MTTSHTAAHPSAGEPGVAHTPEPQAKGSTAVVTMSTIAFTVMFAVWMMFGILAGPIRAELGINEAQYSWVLAAAILNGSMWRLPAGILTDRIGGRKMTIAMLALTAIPCYFVGKADSYPALLALAFLVGFSGNLFTVGTAWNAAWFTRSRQGFALGVFGAGNVGASGTKFLAPVLVTAPFAVEMFGKAGSWRLIPLIYTVLLLVLAVLTWLFVPKADRTPGQSKPVGEMLEPLKEMRVWRFSLYYVVVFGAYVALSSVLPTYYKDAYGVPLAAQAMLTASYIFPASLLRPLGGWASDRWGARKVMYATFGVMLVLCGVLIVPNLPLALFATLVFLVGCAMGVGKAAVYKHIPEYYPTNVGSVGGLVGMLGGLGGFFLPPLFVYVKSATGLQTATFLVLFVITLISAVWMHLTILGMKRNGTDHTGAIDHTDIHSEPSEA